MDKKPNELLNEMVAFYVIFYVTNTPVTSSPINKAAWKFLKRAGIRPETNPFNLEGYYLGNQAADLQRQLINSGDSNISLRSVVRKYKHLMPLVAHGPQAWLIKTYESMLKNIYELDMGIKQYGQDKDVYRDIVENVKAARLMFEEASRKIADKIYQLYGDLPSLALVEGGAGNGAAMLTLLEKFPRHQLPKFLISDIDEKTRLPAEELFLVKGYSEHLPWMKVDLGDTEDLKRVQTEVKGHDVVVSVNFIIHEHETILEKFFQSMSQELPHAHLAISEFFLPENEDEVGTDFPWWFVFLHEVSGQCLRTEKDFMDVATTTGYHIHDRLDHQFVNQKPLVSTLFLTRN